MRNEATSRDAPGVRDSESPEPGLKAYIDENWADLEALAAKEYPVSRVIKQLLDRRDRGEL